MKEEIVPFELAEWNVSISGRGGVAQINAYGSILVPSARRIFGNERLGARSSFDAVIACLEESIKDAFPFLKAYDYLYRWTVEYKSEGVKWTLQCIRDGKEGNPFSSTGKDYLVSAVHTFVAAMQEEVTALKDRN